MSRFAAFKVRCVICTGYVEENDLPAFYVGAKALVYPSFDEGYGLPIAEAAACGCPVITSVQSAKTICPKRHPVRNRHPIHRSCDKKNQPVGSHRPTLRPHN